jgi:hypothetical protein
VLLCAGPAPAAQLLDNGDFVRPSPPHGAIIVMDTGERYGAWRVVGAPGNVEWVNGAYQHDGFSFVSQTAGKHGASGWVNLAGPSQSATGIAHAPIATTPGADYMITFYVGNLYAPGGIYGTSSSVDVYENSTKLGTFTNTGGEGTTTENWQLFTVTFTADAPWTTLAFINADPPGDMNCGVDNITLSPAAGLASAQNGHKNK